MAIYSFAALFSSIHGLHPRDFTLTKNYPVLNEIKQTNTIS